MKKKVGDLTIKEIMSICNVQKSCLSCPLDEKRICIEEVFCPAAWFLWAKELEETEIEIPNKGVLPNGS